MKTKICYETHRNCNGSHCNFAVLETVSARPVGSFVHIPDKYRIAGYAPSPSNRFEFEPVYTDGVNTARESELLAQGIACYRVQIDRFTVRDFKA